MRDTQRSKVYKSERAALWPLAFKPPRPKRVLTPEQREKLIERLQSYRQAA